MSPSQEPEIKRGDLVKHRSKEGSTMTVEDIIDPTPSMKAAASRAGRQPPGRRVDCSWHDKNKRPQRETYAIESVRLATDAEALDL